MLHRRGFIEQAAVITRRKFLRRVTRGLAGLAAFLGWPRKKHALAARNKIRSVTAGPRVAVIGAGVFGAWTAWFLHRQGARVTLVDAWGPGNSRSSSGGESRVIRGTYGDKEVYVRLVSRALQLWKEYERRWNRRLLHRTGVLWFVGKEDAYERGALPLLRKYGWPFERWERDQLEARFPQINFDGIEWGIWEPEAGYIDARESCRLVVEALQREGVTFRKAAVRPVRRLNGKRTRIRFLDGSEFHGDVFVFACGAWLGKLFPDLLGDLIRPSRQEVFFFGTAPGDTRFEEGRLPVWVDHGERLYYGIPGNRGRGFKLADDTRGPLLDPTREDRIPDSKRLADARAYLAYRFPRMKDAPLLEARVCVYENTMDQDFILDRHPEADHIWIVGGGSGHGFKHGPAIGEIAARLILEQEKPEAVFQIGRFFS